MRSLRWKLVITSMVLVFIPIWLLNRYAITFFDYFTRTSLESHMRHYAFAAGEVFRRQLDDGDGVHASRMITALAEETGMHIRIVRPDRSLAADSDPGADSAYAERAELNESFAGGYSARSRLSPSGAYMYYYIARPIKDGRGEVLGVSYVVADTASIIRAITRMVANQRRATILAICVAALVAAIVAWTLTRRLRALTRAARQYAAGNRGFDVRIGGRDEIGELARAARHMAEDIEERNAYNREFVSSVIHELKSPLSAMRGAVEILEQEEGLSDDDRTRFLGNIRHQTMRMVRLVGELRELTRVDTEVLQGQKQRIDLVQFVRDALGRLVPTFDTAHAPCRMDLPEGEQWVNVVPGRIEQVISNLLENALRYTPTSGEVVIRVTEESPRRVVVSVRDTGSGISEQNLPRVFERFFTTEPKGRNRDCGSGLGLAIAKSIIESHGGRIQAASTGSDGTEISFSLPRIR